MKSGTNILVVDDEKRICESVSKVLVRRGYNVDLSLDADDALTKIKKIPYNLVILDIMMPRINGIELLKAIRQEYRECNVVMITGYASVNTAVQSIQMGAQNYISKPFTSDELLKVVEDVLRENPRSGAFCEKGRVECKKFAKSGPCKRECLLGVGGGKEVDKGAKAMSGGREEIIDVDMPFSYDEVERATSSSYVQTLGRSDMPVVGWQKYCRRNNKVLVVDDEVVVCNSIRKILSASNYDVDYANSAGEALDKLSNQKYAVVLLDLRLPDIPGMEVLRQILSRWPETKVAVVTGYATIDTAVAAMRLGAAGYIAKPFTPDELYKVTNDAGLWNAA